MQRERTVLTIAQPPSWDDIQTSQQQSELSPLENYNETTSRIKLKNDGTDEDGPDVEQGLRGEHKADKLKVLIFLKKLDIILT